MGNVLAQGLCKVFEAADSEGIVKLNGFSLDVRLVMYGQL
jgi:hypothetical protein